MAWQFPVSGTRSTTYVDLGITDSVYVGTNVSIAAEGGYRAILGLGNNHQIWIDGSVASSGYAIRLGGNDSNTKNSIHIGRTGTVFETDFDAIWMVSHSSSVYNDGRIISLQDYAVLFSSNVLTPVGEESQVVNTGSIFGGNIGVGAYEAITLVNTGTIEGKYGSFSSSEYVNGIQTITNSGLMIGDITLYGGADLYDGRLGHVQGKVLGGAGIDTIYGGTEDNVIDGGTDADIMAGGAGNDTYIVDVGGDRIVDAAGAAGGSSDVVRASVNYALAPGVAVERMEAATGTAAITLTGNEFNQTILGNEGVNKLNGGSGGNDDLYGFGGTDRLIGGTGNDRLTGGVGNDAFYFGSALSAATNVDQITDFSRASGNVDQIQLENAIFTKLVSTGALNAAFFEANTTGVSTGADNYVVYETDTGKLFYDADGSGAGGSLQFAVLSNKLALTAGDFLIV